MALLFIDGFDHYATAQLEDKWSYLNGSVGVGASSGRNSTQGLLCDATTEYVAKSFSGGTKNTWIVGMAFKCASLPSSVLSICDFYCSQASEYNVGLQLNTDGTLQVVTPGGILGVSVDDIAATTFYYIEFKVYIHDTIGYYEVRLNGSDILSETSVDTKYVTTNQCDTVRIGRVNGATVGDVEIDDVYICDDSGTTNIDFLGDVHVETIYPSAAGNTTGFTPSAGDNYNAVNETTPPNDETDYVSSSTSTTKDTYAFGNMIAAGGTVYGVQTNMWARKDNAGPRTFCDVIRHSAVDYDGSATQYPADTYNYFVQVHEVNPGTDAAWSVTEINNAEFGFKITL